MDGWDGRMDRWTDRIYETVCRLAEISRKRGLLSDIVLRA